MKMEMLILAGAIATVWLPLFVLLFTTRRITILCRAILRNDMPSRINLSIESLDSAIGYALHFMKSRGCITVRADKEARAALIGLFADYFTRIGVSVFGNTEGARHLCAVLGDLDMFIREYQRLDEGRRHK